MIKFSSKNVINTKWMLLYLEKNEIEKLKSTKNIHFFDIPPKYKLKDKFKQNKTYLIRFHSPETVFCFPQIKILSKTKGILKGNETSRSVLSKILKNKNVLSVSMIKNVDLLNRWSSPYLQSGEQFSSIVGDYLKGNRYLNDRCIDGNGQIVTLVDTGIDTKNPFFKDNFKVPFNTFNHSHRKIIRYDTLGNNRDRKCGHGTHVAGIIAGNAINNDSLSLYNGIAPKSKLYFVDIGTSEVDDSFSASFDTDEIINNMKEIDSHIYSSSFGYPIENTEFRANFDSIAEKNKDILFVFACGNKGTNFSIYQPSGSKNVLSIGGATQTKAGNIENPLFHQTFLSFKNKKIILKRNSLYPDLWINNRLSKVSDLSNIKITENNNESENCILKMNDENVCKRIKEASIYNPFAIIINTNKTQNCGKSTVPVFISNEAINSTTANISFVVENKFLSYADFSSKGPSDLGLLKPDLIAPSQSIISACAKNDENPLMSRSGTSMAAPFISGAAALIRQYFTEGYYPFGSKNSTNYINPTGNLLRALLINVGHAPQGKPEKPNYETGFGVPILKDIAIFKNSSSKGYRIGDKINISSNEHYVATMNIKYKDEIRISMAYTDFALDEDSIIPLSSDLDLVVVSPSGIVYYGNEDEETHSTLERVIIHKNESEIGKYEIYIFANNFLINGTIFASVVASGGFDHFDLMNNDKYLLFINKGIYKRRCELGKTGVLCQKEVKQMRIGKEERFIIKERQWTYFSLKIPHSCTSIVLKLSKFDKGNEIIPSVTIGGGEIPKYNGELISSFLIDGKNEIEVNIKKKSIKNASDRIYVGIYPIGNGECSMAINSTAKRKNNVLLCITVIVILILVFYSVLNITKNEKSRYSEQNEYLISEKDRTLP